MAREITLDDIDVRDLERRLSDAGGAVAEDEKQFLRFLLDRAKKTKAQARPEGVDWWFRWTYRF